MTNIPHASIGDMPTGVYAGVRSSDYFKRVMGLVSKSALDLVHRSPAHYKAWLDGADEESTPALEFGTAFHMALLEPAAYSSHYAVEPDFGDCRYKDNRSARDAWRAQNANRASMPSEWASAIDRMVSSVRSHQLAGRMIRDGVPELTIRWQDRETGLQCKGRVDYYVRKLRMAVDVKSAVDASPVAFRKSVGSYRYHVQEAMYRAGLAAAGEDIEHFIFIVVEKAPPYAVAVYSLDAGSVSRGADAARKDMLTLSECMKAGLWPAYGSGIETIDAPMWST